MGFFKSIANFFGFGKSNEENSEILSEEVSVNPTVEDVEEIKQIEMEEPEPKVESHTPTVKEIKSNSKKNKSESTS